MVANEINQHTRFFIDSQAAILALNNKKITSELVAKTVRMLNNASKNGALWLNWTKAHVGTPGNELADKLANQGAINGKQSDMGLPKAELHRKIEEHFYSTWTTIFTNYRGARMGKIFYHGPDKNKAKMVMKLPRLQLARFMRIISGHNSLFYFKHKIDPEISPLCRFCLQGNETFDHLARDCPCFRINQCDFFYDNILSNDCLLYTSPSPRD